RGRVARYVRFTGSQPVGNQLATVSGPRCGTFEPMLGNWTAHSRERGVRRGGALAALIALACLAMPGIAAAIEPTGYGELTRFGETGVTGGEEPSPEPGKLNELRSRAIGVDPTDNSVYVLDEPVEPLAKKRKFRLQKYT